DTLITIAGARRLIESTWWPWENTGAKGPLPRALGPAVRRSASSSSCRQVMRPLTRCRLREHARSTNIWGEVVNRPGLAVTVYRYTTPCDVEQANQIIVIVPRRLSFHANDGERPSPTGEAL